MENKEATDPSEARGFENVITGLKRSYPRDKMEEISTSFCFICLLHLANERGLKLESDADGVPTEEVDDGEKKIGNIWDLKVWFIKSFLADVVADIGCRFIETQTRHQLRNAIPYAFLVTFISYPVDTSILFPFMCTSITRVGNWRVGVDLGLCCCFILNEFLYFVQ